MMGTLLGIFGGVVAVIALLALGLYLFVLSLRHWN